MLRAGRPRHERRTARTAAVSQPAGLRARRSRNPGSRPAAPPPASEIVTTAASAAVTSLHPRSIIESPFRRAGTRQPPALRRHETITRPRGRSGHTSGEPLLGPLRRRAFAQAVDLRSQPSRVVGRDALEHAHSFLELRDQRVSLFERAPETCATHAPPRALDCGHDSRRWTTAPDTLGGGRAVRKTARQNIPNRTHIHGNPCICLTPNQPVDVTTIQDAKVLQALPPASAHRDAARRYTRCRTRDHGGSSCAPVPSFCCRRPAVARARPARTTRESDTVSATRDRGHAKRHSHAGGARARPESAAR